VRINLAEEGLILDLYANLFAPPTHVGFSRLSIAATNEQLLLESFDDLLGVSDASQDDIGGSARRSDGVQLTVG
jgi:hypothetical protein